MMFRLIVLSGPLKGKRLTLDAEDMSLGRDAHCSVTLDEEGIANQHAVIERKGDGFFIRDLGSAEGTRVNDETIEKARLKHGDVIEIGQTRLFVEAVRPVHVGGTGLWALNRVLTVLAFVGLPIAFLYLVAFLERTYLGIGVPPSPPVSTETTATNRSAELPESESGKVENPGEWDLKGIGNTNAVVSETGIHPQPDLTFKREGDSSKEATTSGVEAGSLIQDSRSSLPTMKAIRIASVEETKFSDSNELEEMRVIEVRLMPESDLQQRLTPESIQVDVSLFDRNMKTGDILLTRALVTKSPLRPEGLWRTNEQKSVRVAYVVPKGARKADDGSARMEQYFGYVTKVYYHGELQDQNSRPKSLLNYSIGSGSGQTAPGSSESNRAPLSVGTAAGEAVRGE